MQTNRHPLYRVTDSAARPHPDLVANARGDHRRKPVPAVATRARQEQKARPTSAYTRCFFRWYRADFAGSCDGIRSPGRPPLSKNLQALILTMTRRDPSWGDGRISDELSLKLGVLVDPRTAGKYMKRSRSSARRRAAMARLRSEPCPRNLWRATSSLRPRQRSTFFTCSSQLRSGPVECCVDEAYSALRLIRRSP